MEYYLWTFLKFFSGFSILIIYMNVSGRNQISQMTSIDLIGNFVLGGVIGGVIYNDTISFERYILVLLLGVSFVHIMNLLARKIDKFRSATIGTPIVIIKDGKFQIDEISRNSRKIDMLSIASKMHASGTSSFKRVHFAQLEPDGQVTIINEPDQMPSSIFIFKGEMKSSQIDGSGKSIDWVNEKLNEIKLNHENIFLAEMVGNELIITDNEGNIRSLTT